ncbi:MAG: Ig-like domain-containing protein [Ruminococcus sp.]|nr:Ig-like domain-containing protein [Ruminococcus sp.]
MQKAKIILSTVVGLSVLLSSTVICNAASAKLNISKKTINVGKSFTLKVKNAKKRITWITSNSKIAKLGKINSIKHTIKIKGVKAGKATITANVGKTKLKCKVTVKSEKPKENAPEVPAIKEYQIVSVKAKYTNVITETMNKYMDNLNASSQNAGQLNQQLTQLSQRLTALNNVYGGMLSAMNIKA